MGLVWYYLYLCYFHGFSLHNFFPYHYVCELRIGPPSHGTPVVVYGVINNNIRNIILTLGETNLIRDFWSFAWLRSGVIRVAGHLESRIGRFGLSVHGVEFYTRAKNGQQQHGLGVEGAAGPGDVVLFGGGTKGGLEDGSWVK